MIDFAYPWMLAAVPLPVVVWFLLPPARERSAIAVPDSVMAHLQHHSGAITGSRAARPVELALKAMGWLALVVALAGPYTQKPAALKPTGRDIIVAFDLSASMAEKDMSIGGRELARIDVIREKVGTFVKGRKGDRITLIGFATSAFLIAPPTYDVVAVSEMLDEMTIGLPGRKTDLGQAIGLTVKLFRAEPPGDRMLILISDGDVNTGQIAATDAAKLAADLGISIFPIGFAEQITAPNAAHLADLAQRTGGDYLAATDPALMQNALSALDDLVPITPDQTSTERRQDWRWVPLSLALLCLLVIGWREYRDP